MASVTIKGKEYGLRFDLYAMEQIEDELGSIKAAFEALQKGKQIKTTRLLFKIMANSYMSNKGQEETVTGDEIKHIDIDEVKYISDMIRKTVAEASKSETTDGNEADDEVHDVYLEEVQRKNA